jgi:hypothetical protein
MFAPLGLSAETVFEFVKSAYSSRSDIVHGRRPDYQNLAGERCPAGEQAGELDRLVAAAFRQILCSPSSEPPHATADQLINAALDSDRHPPTSSGSTWYDVTVTHDGSRFMAVPPVDNTYWVSGATVEQLRKRLADMVALWKQTPCAPDQIRLELDDDARAASS